MCIMVSAVMAQTKTSFTLQQKLLKASFDTTLHQKTKARKLVSPKNDITKINPLFYVGGTLLFLYQNVFSEQIQAQCAYQISCSEYTKLSIQKKGSAEHIVQYQSSDYTVHRMTIVSHFFLCQTLKL